MQSRCSGILKASGSEGCGEGSFSRVLAACAGKGVTVVGKMIKQTRTWKQLTGSLRPHAAGLFFFGQPVLNVKKHFQIP
jgi:hypothetical protein